MPALELYPVSTAIVAAGWNDPTNAYSTNNSYTSTSTNNAEQSYDYNPFLSGAEIIDKVFVRLKWNNQVAAVLGGDNATLVFTVKVYDGSTWTSYQVSALTYACTTVNGESFTSIDGDNSNNVISIDCTSILDTLTKLNSAQTAILAAITVEAGLTLTVNVDSISIMVVYHDLGGAWVGAAVTKRDLDKKEYRAIKKVNEYLKVTS